MAVFGAAAVALLALLALGGDLIAPFDPLAVDPSRRLRPPSVEHWLGTDQLGRDVLSRVIVGTRTAAICVAAGLGLAVGLGAALGLIAGYGPRWLDGLLMLLFDAVASLPVFILALALVTLMGPSLVTILIAAVATLTPAYGRVVRSMTLALRSAEFVESARAIGAGAPRILLRHVAPNLAGPLAVLIAMDVPTVIMIESGLSFLGLGVRPPSPSWGSILNDGYAFLRQSPHLILAGALPIVVATIGFTFLGEGLRDVLDPRGRPAR